MIACRLSQHQHQHDSSDRKIIPFPTKNEKRGEVKMNLLQKLLKLKLKGNQKGMTLVELLGVIVILGIVAVIAIPAIGSLITGSERKAQAANAHMLIDATRHYISAKGFAQGATPNIEDVGIESLVTSGFLDSIPKDPYDKTNTYGTTSKVVVTQTTTAATATADQVDTYKFSVYVADAANAKARIGTFTSTVPVDEVDLDKSSSVNAK